MKNILVAGIGTDVGKTIVSAVLTYALDAEYWKPIQCGPCRDAETVHSILEGTRKTHPDGVHFQAPRSPYQAAKEENREASTLQLPPTNKTLVIEGCGGLLVPLNSKQLTIDLFTSWNCDIVLASRHYLGSINHTLLTLEAIQRRGIAPIGIIFNGQSCPETEEVILHFSNIPFLGRIHQEVSWNLERVKHYAPIFQKAMRK